MSPMLKFILTFTRRNWEMRYFCFCLFKADRINKILLWALLPISLITYYWIGAQHESDFVATGNQSAKELMQQFQWYLYFSSQQFYIFILSLIVWNNFKGSPHSAIATAVLVKSIFSLTAELLGINNKFIWINVVWQVLMYALIALAIKHYISRARKTI